MKIKKRTLSSIKVWAIRASIIGTILFVFFFYTKTEVFSIRSFEIQGVDESARAAILTSLEEMMKHSVYLVIPGNKIFTYNSQGVVASVRATITDAATVTMRPIGLHTVRISITLLTPSLRVGDTKAITHDGIIFITKKDLASYPSIMIASTTEKAVKRNGLTFSQLSLNDEPIDASFLESIVEFSSKVSSIIFPVKTITVAKGGDVVLYNEGTTSKIMFLRDQDQKKVWSTLVSAIDTEPLKSKLASEREKLEYLDVRYGSKVFYRFSDMAFQNNGTADIINNHATTTQPTSQATSTAR
jgi:hypothetical protein